MNYLQLCQRLLSETGLPGSVAAVAGQTGDNLRLVNWIKQAYLELQMERQDWRWMRKEKSFNTSAAKGNYTLTDLGVTDLGVWKPETARCYLAADGQDYEYWLAPLEYEEWLAEYGYANPDDAKPKNITVFQPGDALQISPTPDAEYTITLEYTHSPTELSADADTPTLPTKFHMLIVHEAMKMYAIWDNAPEKLAYAEHASRKLRSMLNMYQRPRVILNASPITVA